MNTVFEKIDLALKELRNADALRLARDEVCHGDLVAAARYCDLRRVVMGIPKYADQTEERLHAEAVSYREEIVMLRRSLEVIKNGLPDVSPLSRTEAMRQRARTALHDADAMDRKRNPAAKIGIMTVDRLA